MVCQVESGNVIKLLTILTGAEQTEIENMLMSGTRPAEVADHYGKYDEYKDFLKVNIASKLQNLINEGEIGVKEANRMFNRINEA